MKLIPCAIETNNKLSSNYYHTTIIFMVKGIFFPFNSRGRASVTINTKFITILFQIKGLQYSLQEGEYFSSRLILFP